jgi:peptide/nickel transport system substrate-binding protein
VANFDRRQFLAGSLKAGAVVGAAGLGGTLLEACGSSGSSAPLSTLAKKKALQVGVSTAKPKMGGALSFGTEAEETGMDPSYAHFDSTGVCYARAVYDPLAMILEDGTVAPYLAESIVPNSTYTKWTITVRKDVLFHDGTPCDGAALKFCMQAFLKSALTNFAFTNYMDISNPDGAVVQTGPRTIVMNMEAPWVPFDYWLAGYIGGQVAYMFSPTQYAKGESVLNLHPIGTGPFVYQVWEPGSHFTLTRNPHYWRKDKFGNRLPYLDSWTFKPQPDVDTRYSYLQTNTIQMMHTDDDRTIENISNNKLLTAIGDNELSQGEPDCVFAMINCQDPVMQDITLRQALAYATKPKEYDTVIGLDIVKPTTGPFPLPSPYYSDTGYPSFNLNKAKSLVAAWSAKNGGKKPSITYTTTATTTSISDASVVQTMWQAAGFDVAVTTVQQAALINDALIKKFQVFTWRQFANVNPDLNYIFWAKTAGPINFAGNEDSIIQTALDTARQSTDPAVQKSSYQTIAKRFAVDLPYIWYGRDVWYVAARTNVQNWNNPTSPSGARGLSMLSGTVWPTEVWLD